MSYDGTLNFDTKIDSSGFTKGVKKITSLAKKSLNITSNVIKATTASVTGLATAAVSMGSDFEEKMSKVSAISGAVEEDLERLTEKAKEMGAKTKFSASESAEAFTYMAMAGWKAEDMLAGIEGIMNLAAASGEDLALTSDIVTDALTAFGYSAEDATRFADVLAAAASNSNTNVSLMGTSFKYVAAVCGSLGYSAEDCAVALGLMANSGIKSTMSGAALRNIITNLASPTSKTATAMETLGISLENSDGSMKSLMEVMQDLRSSFGPANGDVEAFNQQISELDDAFTNGSISEEEYTQKCEELCNAMYGIEGAQRAQLATMIAGRQGLAGFLAIVNSSDEDFQKLTEAIYGCDGAAEKMSETMLDNLKGNIIIIKSALEGLGIQIYEELDGPLKDASKSGLDMINRMSDAFENNGFEGLVEEVGNCLSEIALEASENIPKIVDFAIELVHSFVDSIVDNKEEFGKAGARLIESLVKGFSACYRDLWSLGAIIITEIAKGLSENPEEIGYAVGVAISELSDVIVQNLPTFIECGKKVITGFVDGLMEGSDGCALVVTTIIGFFVNLGIVVTTALITIIGVVMKIVDSVQKIIVALGGMEVIKAKLVAAFTKIGTALTSTFSAVIMIVTGAIAAIWSFVDMFINGFSWVKEVIMIVGIALATIGAIIAGAAAWPAVIVAAIIAALATIVILVKDNWNAICDFFVNAWTNTKEFFITAIETIKQKFVEFKDKVGEIITNVVAFFDNLPRNIGYALGYVIGTLISWAQNVYAFFTQTVPMWIENITAWLVQFGVTLVTNMIAAVTSAIEWFKTLPERIKEFLANAVASVTAWGINMYNTISTAVSNAVETAISWFKALPENIKTLLSTTIENLAIWANDFKNKAIDAAKMFCENLVNGIKELPEKMLEIGKNIVEGVWNGIANAKDAFMKNVSDFFGGIVDGVKDGLGINSPSKVFADEVGYWIPPGVSKGFKKAMPELKKNIVAEMTDLTDMMNATVSASTSVNAISSVSTNGNDENTKIEVVSNVYLEGNSKELFNVMRKENDTFKKSTGKTAFA